MYLQCSTCGTSKSLPDPFVFGLFQSVVYPIVDPDNNHNQVPQVCDYCVITVGGLGWRAVRTFVSCKPSRSCDALSSVNAHRLAQPDAVFSAGKEPGQAYMLRICS